MGRYGVGLGLGKRRRIGAPPPPPAPPVNVTPAAISGTAQQNAVLTAAPGAWSGATDGVTGQWRRAAVAIAGETGLTYLQTIDDVGTMIDYFETATNAGGVSTQASNALGPVAAAGGLSSTAATRTTADGVAPEVDLTFGADINPGFYLRIQRTDTSSGGTGDYTAPDMNIRHMLTPDEIPQDASNGTIASLSLQADGYTDPTGAYWQRYRWENEDASLTGPWSEIHDTVVVSVAKLSETTGTEKHTSLTVDPGGLDRKSVV